MGQIAEAVYKYVGTVPGEELPSFAWPGGIPLYYLDEDAIELCPSCANKAFEYSSDVVAAGAHEEGPDMACGDCGAAIESAYGGT